MGSATNIKIPRHVATRVADRFIRQMALHAEKIVIAGSIRREAPEAGDVEIVAIPRFKEVKSPTLFGEALGETTWVSLLDELFHKKYPGLVSGGSRYKKFQYTSKEFPQIKEYSQDPAAVLQIDLFITTVSDFGRILAIRTGSASYSQKMIAGGWNRKGWVGTENGLRLRKECYKKTEHGKWQIKPEVTEVTMPPEFITEEEFFDFIDLKYVEPFKRNWT